MNTVLLLNMTNVKKEALNYCCKGLKRKTRMRTVQTTYPNFPEFLMGKTQPPGTSIYFLWILGHCIYKKNTHHPSSTQAQAEILSHTLSNTMQNKVWKTVPIQTIQPLQNKDIDSFLSANQTKSGKQVFQG